jgi:hypothetical protein
MLHILSVHWKDDRWVDIQLAYFNKNIHLPFKVYAYLNFLPVHHSQKFYYASTDSIKDHATKLNLLAEVVCKSDAKDEDWLLFIDGDAFPISDVGSFIAPILKQFPLAAVQRVENGGDKQPHPLFAVTTVGFWKRISGDWRKGYRWNNDTRSVTDVGGNLLGILEKEKIEWYKILRSNKTNLHVLNFAVYGGVVYHHGASFRPNLARVDKVVNPFKPNFILRLLSKSYLTRNITFYFKYQHENRIKEKNKKQSEEIFKLIEKDREFYKMFLE